MTAETVTIQFDNREVVFKSTADGVFINIESDDTETLSSKFLDKDDFIQIIKFFAKQL